MIFSRALVGSWYCLVWAFTRLSRCCWSCAALARAIRCHVFCNKPFNTRHYEETNVAQNASAISYGALEGHSASMAIDNDAATYYMSANTNGNYRDYLTLDLGASYPISSIDINLAEGSGQNFTVYGAQGSNTLTKTAITDKITGLTAGASSKILTSSDESYRFIIIEQDAAETALGFNDIKVNTIADAQEAASTVGSLYRGKFRMTTQATGAGLAINESNWFDSDPATTAAYYGYKNGDNRVVASIDLGENYATQEVTHIAWQGTSADAIKGSTGYDTVSNFLIVASNEDICSSSNYTTIASIEYPSVYQTGASDYDTGLAVFNVPSALNGTKYRYYGIIKPGPAVGTLTRLMVGTLGFYINTIVE